MITLQEQYDFYLEYFKTTGLYPHPRKLLGLLLFQEREEYSTYIANETDFYLHHEQSIMEKINKVIETHIEGAPHDTLLVIDASTDQNGIMQAKSFKEITDITGIVLTKLDGTAKGGIAIAIQSELGIPVKYIGVGETIDDLQKFNSDDFVNALFAVEE